MQSSAKVASIHSGFMLSIFFLLTFGLLILKSVAPSLFPLYFFYVFLGVISFFTFSSIDFTILSLFKNHFYILSIFLLLLPLFIGQVTRGAIRWIPIGELTIQPAELARPFLLVFFANYLTSNELNLKVLGKAFLLLTIPLFLILIQPSLGVTILTFASFFGVLLSSNLDKRYYLFGFIFLLLFLPISWKYLLADYQKARVISFLDPGADPKGVGYNSIQSMISVGSGELFGRGLGKGVQTQLSFLPERHADFIFASIAEELGMAGLLIILGLTLYLFIGLIKIMENAESIPARAFISGLFLSMLAQVFVHVGMNVGLLPITGIPYPLVSAGGSSLLATMISFGIAVSAQKKA